MENGTEVVLAGSVFLLWAKSSWVGGRTDPGRGDGSWGGGSLRGHPATGRAGSHWGGGSIEVLRWVWVREEWTGEPVQ